MNWDVIWTIANSTFATSLLGALAGAFAGAAAAQHIAEVTKQREELLREIRYTNAAIALGFAVCNSLLAAKKQHIKSLKEGFDSQRAELLEFMEKRASGEIPPNAEFAFVADLQTLQPQNLPMETLRTVMFERLSIIGRPLNLVVTLSQSVQSLEESLEKRNRLIDSYKVQFAGENRRLVPMYFGFPYGGGHVNMEYPNAIEAIYSQTDDGIFFAYLLCKDLYEHGRSLVGRAKVTFKTRLPRISEVDFSQAEADGLMPNQENYSDWTKAFIKHPDDH